jgi:predicted Zn-dependent protease
LPVTVTRLSAAADRMLPLDLRLRLGRYEESERQSLLSEVRTLGAEYSGDAFAVMTLARAEVMLGDPAAARTLLGPLLAAEPENATVLYLMGFSHMQDTHPNASDRETSLTEARLYFARAFRADPQHVPTLYRYAQTYFSLPGPMAVNQLNILMEAYNLAPQVSAISMTSALALLEVERFDEAIPILRALASEPHGNALSARARELLTQAEERRRIAPPGAAEE